MVATQESVLWTSFHLSINILETINCTLYFKKKFSPLSSELPQYFGSNSGPSNRSILYCKRQTNFLFFYLLEVFARGSPLPLMACFLPCTFSLWLFKRMRLGRCCLFVWCQRGADLPWALKHLYSSQAASQIPHKETQGDNSPPYRHSILFFKKKGGWLICELPIPHGHSRCVWGLRWAFSELWKCQGSFISKTLGSVSCVFWGMLQTSIPARNKMECEK